MLSFLYNGSFTYLELFVCLNLACYSLIQWHLLCRSWFEHKFTSLLSLKCACFYCILCFLVFMLELFTPIAYLLGCLFIVNL